MGEMFFDFTCTGVKLVGNAADFRVVMFGQFGIDSVIFKYQVHPHFFVKPRHQFAGEGAVAQVFVFGKHGQQVDQIVDFTVLFFEFIKCVQGELSFLYRSGLLRPRSKPRVKHGADEKTQAEQANKNTE